jgi:hypothetical protein
MYSSSAQEAPAALMTAAVASTTTTPGERRRLMAEEMDAWVGNPGIPPWGGKRGVMDADGAAAVAAAAEHLWGATFRAGPPPGGGWCDLPRIGKRPIADPVAQKGVVRAVHALRQLDALPAGTAEAPAGGRQVQGKRIIGERHQPTAVDVYALLTYKDLGGGGGVGGGGGGAMTHSSSAGMNVQQQEQPQQQRRRREDLAWNDATRQPRRRPPPPAPPGARPPGAPGLLDWAPNRAARFVPYGGLAQERGMNLDDVAAIRRIARQGGGTMAWTAGGRAGAKKGGGAGK